MNAYTAALTVALHNCCVLTSGCKFHSKNGSPAWKTAQKKASLHWRSDPAFCKVLLRHNDPILRGYTSIYYFTVLALFDGYSLNGYVWENTLIHSVMKRYWMRFQFCSEQKNGCRNSFSFFDDFFLQIICFFVKSVNRGHIITQSKKVYVCMWERERLRARLEMLSMIWQWNIARSVT